MGGAKTEDPEEGRARNKALRDRAGSSSPDGVEDLLAGSLLNDMGREAAAARAQNEMCCRGTPGCNGGNGRKHNPGCKEMHPFVR